MSPIFLHLFFYTLFQKRAVSGNNGKRRKIDFPSENALRKKLEQPETAWFRILRPACLPIPPPGQKTEGSWIPPAPGGASVLLRGFPVRWRRPNSGPRAPVKLNQAGRMAEWGQGDQPPRCRSRNNPLRSSARPRLVVGSFESALPSTRQLSARIISADHESPPAEKAVRRNLYRGVNRVTPDRSEYLSDGPEPPG